MFNLANKKGLIKLAQLSFLSRVQNQEIMEEFGNLTREGLDAVSIVGEFKPFFDDLERKYKAGEIEDTNEVYSLVKSKLDELKSKAKGIQPEEEIQRETTKFEEPVETEVSSDVWRGKTISPSTSKEFNSKLQKYKDIPIVARRAGRKPLGYEEVETFADYSPQSQSYMGRLQSNPELLRKIIRRVSKGDEQLASDAVSNAMRSAFSPKFTVAGYASGGAIVYEMQDRHDGRVEFLLSNNEILRSFNNEFKQTGGDLERALSDIGINLAEDGNLYKSNKAYAVVSKELLLHPNNGLDRFIDNLIQSGDKSIDKWFTIKSLSEQKALMYKTKEGESLTGQDMGGKEYTKEGRRPTFEDGKYLTQEEVIAYRKTASHLAKAEFVKVKNVANHVIEHMRSIGRGDVHPTTLRTKDEIGDLRYQSEKLRKADVMQYLINVYESRLNLVIQNGYFTVKPIIGGYIMTFRNPKTGIEELSNTPGFLRIKLGEAGDGSIDMNFSKLITNFGVVGQEDKKESEKRVIDHFYDIINKKLEIVKKLKEEIKRHRDPEQLKKEFNLSDREFNYYLTTAEQDFDIEYQVPAFEQYKEIRNQQSRLKMIVLKDIYGYYQKNRKLPPIELLRKRVINFNVELGYTGSLTDIELKNLENKFLKYIEKRYSTEMVEKDIVTSDEQIQEEYDKNFQENTRRKRITGDDIRPEIANWGLILLRKLKSGEIDQSGINTFFKVFPMHSKLTKGTSFSDRMIPVLIARYGTFENLPEDIRDFLLSKGIQSLKLPDKYKLSKSQLMMLFAFVRAQNKLSKLWELKNRMMKVAGFSSKTIDERMNDIIDDAIEEIENYENI